MNAIRDARRAKWQSKVADAMESFEVAGIDATHDEMLRKVQEQTAVNEARMQMALESVDHQARADRGRGREDPGPGAGEAVQDGDGPESPAPVSDVRRGRGEDHRQEGRGEVSNPPDGLAAQDGAVPLPRAARARRGWLAASWFGLLDRASRRLFPALEKTGTLSPGDFPAGVTAPGGDIASVPLRPTLVGFTPRGLGGLAPARHGWGGRRRGTARGTAPDRLLPGRAGGGVRSRGGPPQGAAGRRRARRGGHGRPRPWTGWRAGSTRSATPRPGWCCCSPAARARTRSGRWAWRASRAQRPPSGGGYRPAPGNTSRCGC